MKSFIKLKWKTFDWGMRGFDGIFLYFMTYEGEKSNQFEDFTAGFNSLI